MLRRSDAVSVIVASGVCAALLWASQGLADLVRRPALSRTVAPATAAPHPGPRLDAMSNARLRGRIAVAPSSMPTVSFQPTSYSMAAPVFLSDPAAAQADSIAVGDVSGDGRDDLVFLSLRYAPNPMDNRMEIYVAYQRGDGRLDPAVKIGESGNNLAYQLLIADLNRDGAGDIVTATVDGVMVLRSNADGTFTSSTAVVGDPYDILVTDVDRDGDLDILVDSSNTSATVVHVDGLGGIERISTLPLPSSAVRTTGDVTGDGLDDLILATIFNSPLQEFRVYPALATGGYAAPVVLSRPIDANQIAALAVGDFNADGRDDLALDEARDDASLHLYFQDSQGNLAPSLALARRRGSGSLLAADLDRDGRTDLAIAHSGWGYIGYYLQTITGLAPETVIDAYQYQGRLNYFAAGDLNHDGCGDLVVSRTSQSPVLVYGQGCPRARIANCRYPAAEVQNAGLLAAGSASPFERRRVNDEDAGIGAVLTRRAAARFGRD